MNGKVQAQIERLQKALVQYKVAEEHVLEAAAACGSAYRDARRPGRERSRFGRKLADGDAGADGQAPGEAPAFALIKSS